MLIGSNVFASYIVYDLQTNTVIEKENATLLQPVASLTKLVTAMVCIDSGRCDETLLKKLLVRSDNKAAEEIATKHKGGRSQFIKAMNEKTKGLGLTKTNFHDPSGLSVFNVSTANEFIHVVIEAEKYNLIRDISSSMTVKQKKVTLYNTNIVLMNQVVGIVLSKTGFTNHAGRCLALVVQTSDEHNLRKHAIVILGEESPDTRTRLARRLIDKIR